MSDDALTAIHESGHAVAFLRLFPYRERGRLSIEPDHDSLGRHAAEELLFFGEGALTDEQLDECENQAVYACAGYAALIAAGHSADVAVTGCGNDFEQAQAASRRGLQDVMAAAVDLMGQAENIQAVSVIAAELLLRRVLDDDEVGLLLDVADGQCSREEYNSYLLRR